MLAQARRFFHDRGVLEVDCPLITQAASVDAHIDLIAVRDGPGWRYLHSSPESSKARSDQLAILECGLRSTQQYQPHSTNRKFRVFEPSFQSTTLYL